MSSRETHDPSTCDHSSILQRNILLQTAQFLDMEYDLGDFETSCTMCCWRPGFKDRNGEKTTINSQKKGFQAKAQVGALLRISLANRSSSMLRL